jgi:hypothetical protein
MPTEQRNIMLKNSQHSYGRLARAFHWLSALAVIAALAFIEFKDIAPKGSPLRDFLKSGHFQAGIIVLLLFYRACCGDWPTGYPTSPRTAACGHAAGPCRSLAAVRADAGLADTGHRHRAGQWQGRGFPG